MGPFSYIPFFMGLFAFNNFAYDMRTAGHKLMGFVCYVFILLNRLVGDSYLPIDLALFALASFYFYQAMSNNFDRTSRPAIATMMIAALLIGGAYWETRTVSKSQANRPKSKTEIEAEAALKAVLQQAQQTTEGMRQVQ
jgi:thiol:disulfide interchange protein